MENYSKMIGDEKLEKLFDFSTGDQENETLAYGEELLAEGHKAKAAILDAMIHACDDALEMFRIHNKTHHDALGDRDKKWFESKRLELMKTREELNDASENKFQQFWKAYEKDQDKFVDEFLDEADNQKLTPQSKLVGKLKKGVKLESIESKELVLNFEDNIMDINDDLYAATQGDIKGDAKTAAINKAQKKIKEWEEIGGLLTGVKLEQFQEKFKGDLERMKGYLLKLGT